jgi:hypothetical protein
MLLLKVHGLFNRIAIVSAYFVAGTVEYQLARAGVDLDIRLVQHPLETSQNLEHFSPFQKRLAIAHPKAQIVFSGICRWAPASPAHSPQ